MKELHTPRVFWGVGEKAPLLMEGTCILSGKPGIGKSGLAISLCRSAVRSLDFLGRKTEECAALYLDLESGEVFLPRRLRDVLEANPARGFRHFYAGATADRIGHGLGARIEQYMRQDPEIGIIVIDGLPWARTTPEETGYGHMYRSLGVLNELAGKHHVSIIVISHDRRAVDPDDPFSSITGSAGLQGLASQTMVMYRRQKEEPVRIAVRGRAIEGEPELEAELKDGVWTVVDHGKRGGA